MKSESIGQNDLLEIELVDIHAVSIANGYFVARYHTQGVGSDYCRGFMDVEFKLVGDKMVFVHLNRYAGGFEIFAGEGFTGSYDQCYLNLPCYAFLPDTNRLYRVCYEGDITYQHDQFYQEDQSGRESSDENEKEDDKSSAEK